MAESFFNKLSRKHKGLSAGTNVGPNDKKPLFDPKTGEGKFVIKSMSSMGYDLSHKKRKQITRKMAKEVDKIVFITSKNNLPGYLRNSKKVIFWRVADGKNKPYYFHVTMRDRIKDLVKKLVKDIG